MPGHMEEFMEEMAERRARREDRVRRMMTPGLAAFERDIGPIRLLVDGLNADPDFQRAFGVLELRESPDGAIFRVMENDDEPVRVAVVFESRELDGVTRNDDGADTLDVHVGIPLDPVQEMHLVLDAAGPSFGSSGRTVRHTGTASLLPNLVEEAGVCVADLVDRSTGVDRTLAPRA